MAASVDPLSDLRDIHLPPQPAGLDHGSTWMLAVAALIIGSLLAWRLWRRRYAWRRAAIAALEDLHSKPAGEALTGAAMVMRRLMLQGGDRGLSRLSGENWLAELDKRFHTDFFTRGAGRLLGSDLYKLPAGDSYEPEALIRGLARILRRGPRPW